MLKLKPIIVSKLSFKSKKELKKKTKYSKGK